MQTAPISSIGGAPVASASAQSGASAAFGLSFDALLRIILTQLTYQDPLKPMDNYQFVSQLAQFSQIQIGQTTNDRLEVLVSAQATLQAAGLLGREVDIGSGAALTTGTVRAISFENGEAQVTIETTAGATISKISMGSITQIREAD